MTNSKFQKTNLPTGQAGKLQITKYKKQIGLLGETIAKNYLIKNNYQILEQNFKTRFGEIDLIAKYGKTVVFIEVKSRTNLNYGQPQEAVGFLKQQRLIKTAYYYINSHNLDENLRVDVIAVTLNMLTRKARLVHFKDALTEY